MIEQKLLGVDQGPNDIFIGPLGVLLVLFNVGQRDRRFFGRWNARKREQVQLADLGVVRTRFVARQAGRAAAGCRELALNLAGVEQVQALGEIGFAGSLALAGARSFGPAKDSEEV